MKRLLLLFFFLPSVLFAQNSKKQRKAKLKTQKQDKIILDNLKNTVTYLSDDKLEGRRTGTPGEKLAYGYLEQAFQNAGFLPKGDAGTYLQKFEVKEGKQVLPSNKFSVNGEELKLNEDYFPFVFSDNKSVNSFASPAISEKDAPWFLDIYPLIKDNEGNPHFDLYDGIRNKVMDFTKKGANAVIVYNSNKSAEDLAFDGKLKVQHVSVPVIYLTKKSSQKYLDKKTNDLNLDMTVSIGEKERNGHNVIGFIDNGAQNTIIIGGHFDHLGYGEDHNSLWTGKPEIHNGADDNASGTAAVLELGKLLKASKLKNNNYLLICFSGEELGLFGSKYFVENSEFSAANVNYMINMDMIGRLRDSSKSITIGGFGTSPVWANVLPAHTNELSITFDSSGIGPSDHTSFYLKNIPVLFFFTGTHSDYHKPTDDVEKINFDGELNIVKYIYNLIEKTDALPKLSFLKTKEPQTGDRAKFTVSLGVMPDYTYSGTGLHIDGVIDGRVADLAGVKTGDVVTSLGDYPITEINSYMKALSKFKKGDSAKLVVKRGDKELVFNITF